MRPLILARSDVQLHKLERMAQQRGTRMDALVREVRDDLTAQRAYDITHDSL